MNAHNDVAALLKTFDALQDLVLKSALRSDKLSLENVRLKAMAQKQQQEISWLRTAIEEKNAELKESYMSKAKAADDSILKLNSIAQELAASTQLRAVKIDHDKVVSINKTLSRELAAQANENELLLKQKRLAAHDLQVARSYVINFDDLKKRNAELEDDNIRLRRSASEGAMRRFTKGSDANKRKR